MDENKLDTDSITLLENIDKFKEETVQESLAQKISRYLFPQDNDQKNFALTINNFIDDYLENGQHMPIQEWLLGRFSTYPEIWRDEQEKQDTAKIIIDSIETLTRYRLGIEESAKKGKTLTNYLNKNIDQFANTYQVNAQEIAEGIENGITHANQELEQGYFGYAMNESADPDYQNSPLPRRITKTAELNAQLNLANYGVRAIGTRLYNAATGKPNLSRTEELTNIVRSAIDSSEHKGIQVAVSGGTVVSAKKGFIKNVFDTVEHIENGIEKTRAYAQRIQEITLTVADGIEDVRLWDRVEEGAMHTVDVMAEKAKFTVAKTLTAVENTLNTTVTGVTTGVGEVIGGTVGALLGPTGMAIGGVIGGFLGNRVGKFIGDKVIKPVANAAKKIASTAISGVAHVAKKVVSGIGSVVRGIGSAIGSLFSSLFDIF